MAGSAPFSERGNKIVKLKGNIGYFKAVMDAGARPRTEDDPDGFIIGAIAENRLTCGTLQRKLRSAPEYPDDAYYYDNPRGIARLRDAFAGMLQATFMQGVKVDPQDLTLSAGASAILDNLFYMLGNPGDGVLIPAPYYPAFDIDLQLRNDIIPVPVHLTEDNEIEQQLDAAAKAASASGKPICALLVTNPDNPTGKIYKSFTLMQMLRWSFRKKVHIVSDEIYANSIFKPEQVPKFVSMLKLAQDNAEEFGPELDSLLHIIFGLSKDWCASGFRVGGLLSKNPLVNSSMEPLGIFSAVAGPLAHVLAVMLEDINFVHSFIQENCKLLGQAHDEVTSGLDELGVPYVPAAGSVFILMDLRKWLPAPTWEGESQLWQAIIDNCRIVFTPGSACHAAHPGFFRWCYARDPPGSIAAALARLKPFLAARTPG